MGLLSSIAAALSEGVGNGMEANPKCGIAEDEQAKKEAAENSRLEKTLAKYDADRESREKIYGMQAEEGKADREARAKESAADRDLQWRIANLNNSRRGSGGSNADELRGLMFVDGKITDFDTAIGNLYKAYDSEMDPQKQQVIAGQIDVLRAQRKNFITNPATLSILDSSGSFGKAYKAALFTDEQDSGGGSGNETTGASTNPAPKGIAAPSRPAVPLSSQQDIYTGQKQEYPSSKDFTNPQVGTSDVTSKYLYRQGGTTAADAANAISKLGYHLPDAY